MILTEKEVEKYTLDTLPRDLFFEAKRKATPIARWRTCSTVWKRVAEEANELGIKRDVQTGGHLRR